MDVLDTAFVKLGLLPDEQRKDYNKKVIAVEGPVGVVDNSCMAISPCTPVTADDMTKDDELYYTYSETGSAPDLNTISEVDLPKQIQFNRNCSPLRMTQSPTKQARRKSACVSSPSYRNESKKKLHGADDVSMLTEEALTPKRKATTKDQTPKRSGGSHRLGPSFMSKNRAEKGITKQRSEPILSSRKKRLNSRAAQTATSEGNRKSKGSSRKGTRPIVPADDELSLTLQVLQKDFDSKDSKLSKWFQSVKTRRKPVSPPTQAKETSGPKTASRKTKSAVSRKISVVSVSSSSRDSPVSGTELDAMLEKCKKQ